MSAERSQKFAFAEKNTYSISTIDDTKKLLRKAAEQESHCNNMRSQLLDKLRDAHNEFKAAHQQLLLAEMYTGRIRYLIGKSGFRLSSPEPACEGESLVIEPHKMGANKRTVKNKAQQNVSQQAAQVTVVKSKAQAKALTPSTIVNNPSNFVQAVAASGRPIRVNQGQGGALAQILKTGQIVGAALEKAQAKRALAGTQAKGAAKKRAHDGLDNAPVSMPENDMAPPPSKRMRGQIAQPAPRGPTQPEPPLQMAPLPQRFLPLDLDQQKPQVAQVAQGSQASDVPLLHLSSQKQNPKVPVRYGKKNVDEDEDADDVNSDSSDSTDKEYGAANEGSSNDRNNYDQDDYDQDDYDQDMDDYDERNNNFYNKNADDYDALDPEAANPAGLFLNEDEPANFDDEHQEAANPAGLFLNEDEPANFDDEHQEQEHQDQGNAQDNDDEEPNSGLPEPNNVLKEHHKKNPSYQPPKLDKLANAAVYQQRLQAVNETDLVDGVDEDIRFQSEEFDAEDEEENAARKGPAGHTATSHSKPLVSTSLNFYPPVWRIVIVRAKVRFRRFVAKTHTFPTKAKNLNDAGTMLTEEIARGEDEGLMFEAGYAYTRDMATVVFDEGSTYRCKLKTMGRDYVIRYYRQELDPVIEGNQEQEQVEIKANVRHLLDGCSYLKNGFDDNGRTNNFAHPCIKALCINFFYKGEDSLAHHFPEDFKDAIPGRCIILVMTCIANCINEYKDFGSLQKIKFTKAQWQPTVNALAKFVNQIKADEYHGQKFRANRLAWAKAGMKLQNPKREDIDPTISITLD
ncbi:hypothetical protein BDZ97DRAFT_1931132 [Flammula alnicola]|nr:hypothetical protein BDZ97DRAFT_1931132 [Flammula alnicola]